MKIQRLVLILIVFFSTNALSANLINDMQTCQALIEHVGNVLNDAPDNYPENDIKKVKNGLEQYNKYIQDEIIDPGLLKFNAGDKSKAKAMQAQVNAYKNTVINAYDDKYKNKLFTDHAVSLNECTKKAVPSGDSLESLKAALMTIIELAKL